MKKAILAMFASILMFAISTASAADANLIKDTGGNAAYGLRLAVAVDKDTSTGFNRALVTYLGDTSSQPVADDSSWSKYEVAKAAILARGGMQVGSTSRYISVADAKFTDCYQGQSRTWFPLTYNPILAGDSNCSFRNAVNGNSN